MFIVLSQTHLVILGYENVEEPAWKRRTGCVL